MIGLGSDHLGFDLKQRLQAFLTERGESVHDFGAFSSAPVDYPDVAVSVAGAVRAGRVERGILVCGTGLGMAIAANKMPGIFAAPAADAETARRARRSNNAQIITLGADVVGTDTACAMVDAWLSAEFKGGDSARKVGKIRALEQRYSRYALPALAVGG